MDDSSVLGSIPIVDFGAYSLEKESPDPERLQKLVDEVHRALTTIGFLYLKNTGCPANVIKNVFEKSKVFFDLDKKEKSKYRRGDIIADSNFGYIELEQEGLNPERRKDLKEAFNYEPAETEKIPNELAGKPELNDMMEALRTFFEYGKSIHDRLLEIIAKGFNFEDTQYFVKRHKSIGEENNVTMVRSLYYPPIRNKDVKHNQIRCGEHVDYGCVALLIQNNEGLEALNVKGQWIKVTPIEGTILVNIGELMQRWTSDRLIATKHRVIIKSSEDGIASERQSFAFFGSPDKDVTVECVDGSGKYPPVGSMDFLASKLKYSAAY